MNASKKNFSISLFINMAFLCFILFNYFVITPNKINRVKEELIENKSSTLANKIGNRSGRNSETSDDPYRFHSLSGLEDGELKMIESEVEGYILSSLFRNYPEKGIEIFAGLNPAFKSDQATMLCSALMQRDPQSALAWLNSEKGDLRPEVYKDNLTSIINFLATSDPDQALALANSNKENILGDGVYFSIMDGYASKDINRAIDYMKKHESLGLSDDGLFEMYNVMMRRFAESDANHASELVAKLQSPNLQLRVAPGLTDQLLAAEGIEKSLAWVDSLTNKYAKVQSLERIVTHMDQDQAVNYFSKHEGNNDYFSESAQRLAFNQVVTSNPEKAAQLLQQSSNNQAPEMAKKLVDEWIGRDADSTLAWIQALPASGIFDAAASHVAPSLYEKAPLDSARLIQRINDTDMRMDAIESFAQVAPIESIKASLSSFQGAVTPDEYTELSNIYAGRVKDTTSELFAPEQ